MSREIDLSCPVPFSDYRRVVLAHGGGGRVMQRLIRDLFVAAFDNPLLAAQHDGVVLEDAGPVVVTTDAFVVQPLFFPGGDIGSLAVHGSVNDLAVSGARPRYLTAAFVLEEGLELEVLRRVVESMAEAARRCEVSVVAGDTKVVERGKGDGVFITTTGVGSLLSGASLGPERVRPGDVVLVSGPVGDHGVAVMLEREGIAIESDLRSDSASVAPATTALLEAGVDVRCMRDVTRGGLATVLNEVAQGAGAAVRVQERAIPVRDAVADACELMGLDPLYVACEGRFVAFVGPDDAERAWSTLRAAPGGAQAARIGAVEPGPPGSVVLESPLGGERVLDLLSGEQLPRIC